MLPLREKVATNEDTINLDSVFVAVPTRLIRGNGVANAGGGLTLGGHFACARCSGRPGASWPHFPSSKVRKLTRR
jgi:hypothetical protein